MPVEQMGQLSFDGLNYEQDLRVWNFKRLLSKKYDVVVTNPPYMGSSGMNPSLTKFMKNDYPNGKSDLFAAFLQQGNYLTKKNGFNCMVTMQSWMFLSSFETLRKEIVNAKTITTLMHMENMVMGIAFGTAVANIRGMHITGYKGQYNHIEYSLIENDQPKIFPPTGGRNVSASADSFSKIPGSPISYWASENLIKAFVKGKRMDSIVNPKQGLATADNDRFLRQWWEIDINKAMFNAQSIQESHESGLKWFPYNKGGSYRRWYGNYDYLVNWKSDGYEIRNFTDDKGKLRSRPQNTDFYFQEAITWSDITSGAFSMRWRTGGGLHDVKGMSAFSTSRNDKLYLLGLLNTKLGDHVFKLLNPTISLQIGNFQQFPVLFIEAVKDRVKNLAEECIIHAKDDWDYNEESWDYKINPLV